MNTCRQYDTNGTCSYGGRCKFVHVARMSEASSVGSVDFETDSGDSSETPLEHFFAAFPDFRYNPGNSASAEFYRLCDSYRWERDDPDRTQAHQDFKYALTKQFNAHYGTDVNDINAWQGLCARIGVDPIPTTLEECREVVLKTHVNLVDLVDVYKEQGRVTVYSSVEELSKYTIKEGKYFPKEEAYAGELLKCLLRNILDPSKDKERYGARSGRGKRGKSRRRGQ